MTRAELAEIMRRKDAERCRRIMIAAARRKSYEAAHQQRLREAAEHVP